MRSAGRIRTDGGHACGTSQSEGDIRSGARFYSHDLVTPLSELCYIVVAKVVARVMTSDIGDPFVGREREMAGLSAALDDAVKGSGQLVMLVGEAGIGKTRAAEEVARSAADRDAIVAWGRCPEQPGAPPLWPWTEILRSLASQFGEERFLELLGDGAGRVAAAVPELAHLFPEPALTASPEDFELSRFRLYDALETFLSSSSRIRPLVLVLENLHWADEGTLGFMEFITPRLGESSILVVSTYRDSEVSRRHPLSRTLAALNRERSFERLRLTGLPDDHAASLFQHFASVADPSPFVDPVIARAQGNPFFLKQFARLLVRSPEFDPNIDIPEGIRELIERQLDDLAAQTNHVLRLAAVIGRRFDPAVLALLVDDPSMVSGGSISESRLLSALEEALENKVIVELSEKPGSYQFTHPVMQETLAQELSAARRARVHARVGEALEQFYGGDSDAHAAELVPHFAEAETLIGPEKLIRYSIIAGERALASFGYEAALRFFADAEAALSGEVDNAQRAAILAGIARARVALPGSVGDQQQAWDTLRQAFDLYLGLEDYESATDLAIEPVAFLGLTGTVDVTRLALEHVDPDSEKAGWLQARHGAALDNETGDVIGARSALDRARVIARKNGNRSLEARVLVHIAQVESSQLNPRGCIDAGTAAMELARAANDPFTEMRVPVFMSTAMLRMGDSTQASSLMDSTAILGRQFYRPQQSRIDTLCRWWIALMRGDTVKSADARRSLEGTSADPSQDAGRVFGFRAAEYMEDGLTGGVDSLVADMRRERSEGHTVSRWLAGPLALATRTAATPELLDEAEWFAKAVQSTSPGSPSLTELSDVVQGFISVARGDIEAASNIYVSILPRRGLANAIVGTSHDRLLGLLAHTAGRPDDASSHFEDALEFCRSSGYRPELAWTCHDYAEMLSDRRGRWHPSKVHDLIDEGLSIANDLGFQPLASKLSELSERVVDSAPVAYPDGLSTREVEVLRLVAAGRSNQEIADELVISIHTVHRHMQNILGKTGAANRAEAAAHATRNGLVPAE